MKTGANEIKKILIVEDNLVTIFIIEKLLGKYFQTHSVTNGYEALKVLEDNNYDVILMDINLGNLDMDGIKTMQKIKFDKRHKRTKIIAITTFSDERQWYIKQGFDELIIKPLLEEQTITLINNLFHKYTTIKKIEA